MTVCCHLWHLVDQRFFFLRNRSARVALLYLRGSGHALSPILFKFLLWTHLVVKRQNTLMFVTGVNRCHVNLVNNEKKTKKTYQLWTYKKGLPTNAIYHRHEKTFVLLSIFIKWRKIDGASQYFLNFPVIFFFFTYLKSLNWKLLTFLYP